MNNQQHGAVVFRSLTNFNRRQAPRKKVCPLALTPLETRMYKFCPRCGEPVSSHRTLQEEPQKKDYGSRDKTSRHH